MGDEFTAAFYGGEAAKRLMWIARADYSNAIDRELFVYWAARAYSFAVNAAHAAKGLY